uniref:Uncharacterized protein n=1 Tax=Arundo donax TaxID=35708 RepID=A0A0A9EQY2_ARUDO
MSIGCIITVRMVVFLQASSGLKYLWVLTIKYRCHNGLMSCL